MNASRWVALGCLVAQACAKDASSLAPFPATVDQNCPPGLFDFGGVCYDGCDGGACDTGSTCVNNTFCAPQCTHASDCPLGLDCSQVLGTSACLCESGVLCGGKCQTCSPGDQGFCGTHAGFHCCAGAETFCDIAGACGGCYTGQVACETAAQCPGATACNACRSATLTLNCAPSPPTCQ